MEKRSSGLLQRTQRRRMGKRPWATLRNPKGSARRQGLTVEDVGPPPNVPFVSPPSYLSNHPIPVALLTILIIILLFPLDLKIYRYPHHFQLARRQRMPMLRTDDALGGKEPRILKNDMRIATMIRGVERPCTIELPHGAGGRSTKHWENEWQKQRDRNVPRQRRDMWTARSTLAGSKSTVS